MRQGLSGRVSGEPRRIPRYVVRPYKDSESDGYAAGSLTANEFCDIISKYAIDHETINIFLDAFDECGNQERDQLTEALNSIIAKAHGAAVKITISSRDDLPLRMFFNKHETHEVYVDEHRNKKDIDAYVKAQARKLAEKGRLSLLGGTRISKNLQETIIN